MDDSLEIFPYGGIGLRSDTPFYGSANGLMELLQISKEWHEVMISSKSVRQMVLETWLLVDFFSRQLLATGLEIHRYSTEELDLRYEALPDGFERRLSLMQKLCKAHAEIMEPPLSNRTTMNAGFAFWLAKNHREFVERLTELEDEFKKITGNPVATINLLSASFSKQRPIFPLEKLSESWLDKIANLNEAWFKSAARLNSARNVAAHSTSVARIAQRFGVAGDDTLTLVRAECRQLADVLIGLVQTINEEKLSE